MIENISSSSWQEQITDRMPRAVQSLNITDMPIWEHIIRIWPHQADSVGEGWCKFTSKTQPQTFAKKMKLCPNEPCFQQHNQKRPLKQNIKAQQLNGVKMKGSHAKIS